MAQHGDIARYEMPTAREIELDLALASPSWQSLLRGTHAVVIGGGMAGLMSAAALSERFDRVTIVDRDCLPPDARFRDGVPQSRHLHGLLRRGIDVLEALYPGLESELIAAGAVRFTARDALRMSAAGWARRFDSPPLMAASRELIEWTVRRRTLAAGRVTVLHEHEVDRLIASADGTAVTGLHLRPRRGAETTLLAADLVVDASGRSSKAPDWLDALGYGQPKETLIDSFLGYASCIFAIPRHFHADWKFLMLGDKPPSMPRAGVLAPIEGGRWMVTLGGYGRDYPPTDREGFMEFAASLRSDILYQAIKDAEPLTRISGFRHTMNRRRHFEAMPSWPERFVVVGDAACAFNPIYGQGMSVAAITAAALREEAVRAAELGFARRMQARVAAAGAAAWVIATGADVRYPTTVGRQPGLVDRLMQRYLDRVIEVSMQDPIVNNAFLRVVHLLDAPPALFKPGVAWRALKGVRAPILEPPILRPDRALKPAHA
jgi:2-polyprenyl-6-methoxyphenol hydroxylase-like FAD-dependent oxidoreductase